MMYETPDCPLILAGVMAGKSGYTACRKGRCAWWDNARGMCCIAAAASSLASLSENGKGE